MSVQCETVAGCFRDSFAAQPERIAIRFFRGEAEETTMTFGDLARESNRMAHGFSALGVGRGERVLLYLDKSVAFVIAYLALQKMGAIAVPLNPGFKEHEMRYLMHDAAARLVLCGPAGEATLQQVDAALRRIVVETDRPYQALNLFPSAPDDEFQADLAPGDPALIIYTSGTTGKPKGAVLTQGNLAHDAKNIIDVWEISSDDTLCHALPLFHVHGLCFALNTALIAGTEVVMLDRFTPVAVLGHLTRKTGAAVCSIFMAVPQMYAKLMAHLGERRYDFDHLRLWTSGSAPLLASDFEKITRIFGKEPVEREGMSETGMNFSNPLRARRKPGSIGLPFPGLQVRIVNPETLSDVAPGDVGELWLQGPSITPGYWRKPEETAQAFEGNWFRSGDLGKVDGEGYYYLTDRLKHIIISGGENISPKEVQAVINGLAGVAESAVVGVPDAVWGEKVVAAVVLRPGASVTEEQIRNHSKGQLHDRKCPKDIRFLSEMPRNTMGKVLNEAVKEHFV